MAHLPPRDQSAHQMNTGHMLGTAHYTRLGHSPRGYFGEPWIDEMAGRSAAKPDEVERVIAERKGSARGRRDHP